MKCTIENLKSFERSNGRIGTMIQGFMPIEYLLIPDKLVEWINNDKGVKVRILENGLAITTVAHTTCLKDDSYDYGLGKHISETKAKIKLFKFICNLSEKLANYHLELYNKFSNTYDKYDFCLARDQEHAKFLGQYGQVLDK